MKYLGIDYGKKKIGLSLSEGQLASAWQVLAIANLNQALERIFRIVRDEAIDAIVIGLPESGESRSMVKRFLQEFKKISNVTIIEHPETLSSFNARQNLLDLGAPRGKRGADDAVAASLILQDYLDAKP